MSVADAITYEILSAKHQRFAGTLDATLTFASNKLVLIQNWDLSTASTDAHLLLAASKASILQAHPLPPAPEIALSIASS